MKATKLLETQHREVKSLFKRLERDGSDQQVALEELANSLAAHMTVEQDIFYPAIRRVAEELVNESYEEHALAEVALKRLLTTAPEERAFKARLTALEALIDHHVQEEEEAIFPQVEAALDEEALEQLGRSMQERFDEVFEGGFEAALPKGWAKTSADIAKKAVDRKGASKKAPRPAA
ncbi:MAG TPA: hemerythrin domain-containing protein [Polyangiaceae bacterium]|nr:hemerythrin domain-containing protein [Polyangiaceae bacterium]